MKTQLILACVLASLVSFASWYQYKHKVKEAELNYQSKNPLFLPDTGTQIAEIKIKNPQGLIELKCESVAQKKCTVKGMAVWKLGNDPADANEVRQFLLDVLDSFPAEPIDLSIETLEKRKLLLVEYGLSEEQRNAAGMTSIELTLIDEKGIVTHPQEWIGNDDPLGQSAFVGSGVDGKMNELKAYVLNKRLKILTIAKSADSFHVKSPAN